MDKTVQLPLCLNLGSASQTKSIKLFITPDIGKHWFNNGHPMAMLAITAVDSLFHPVGAGGSGIQVF
jgi:hypothetical protein